MGLFGGGRTHRKRLDQRSKRPLSENVASLSFSTCEYSHGEKTYLFRFSPLNTHGPPHLSPIGLGSNLSIGQMLKTLPTIRRIPVLLSSDFLPTFRTSVSKSVSSADLVFEFFPRSTSISPISFLHNFHPSKPSTLR